MMELLCAAACMRAYKVRVGRGAQQRAADDVAVLHPVPAPHPGRHEGARRHLIWQPAAPLHQSDMPRRQGGSQHPCNPYKCQDVKETVSMDMR